MQREADVVARPRIGVNTKIVDAQAVNFQQFHWLCHEVTVPVSALHITG